MPKYYSFVCADALDQCDYENAPISFDSFHIYDFIETIGDGRYSSVMLAENKVTHEEVAIKVLEPIEEYRILREVKIL